MAETPTISVRGVGRATLPPDRTVITFELEALKTDYLDSINDLNARVETLRDRLEKAGFARSDLKTMLAPDIEPDDVRAEDSVTVVFELER